MQSVSVNTASGLLFEIVFSLGTITSYHASPLVRFHINNAVLCLGMLAHPLRSPTQQVAICAESVCKLPVYKQKKPVAPLVSVCYSPERLCTGAEHSDARWSPFYVCPVFQLQHRAQLCFGFNERVG